MKLSKYILPSLVAMALAPALASCSDDDFTESIFPDGNNGEADETSVTYKFDTWLNRNFRDVYNLEFCYRLEDVETDKNYNLVPAEYSKARDLALLVRDVWFDAYKEVAGPDLLKQYGPRMIHLIGSSAKNPSTGTEILGLAEGGIKVSLFKVNNLDLNDQYMLNEYYFRTMHHEFSHILHQTKSYPTEFNLLSTGKYDDNNWQDLNVGPTASRGFVTPYGSSQAREDFAETIANYVTRTPEQYDLILWMAKQGWYSPNADDLGSSDNSAYAYYYYASDADRTNENPTMTFVAGEASGKVYVYESYTKSYCYSVEEVEAAYNKLDAALRAQYKRNNPSVTDATLATLSFVYPYSDNDGIDGYSIMTQKVSIARNWLKEQWGTDLDKLRETVQRRQNNFNIEALRAEIDAIQ
jgi:substrate import-associated zinc metallohydrolase lipoprotein